MLCDHRRQNTKVIQGAHEERRLEQYSRDEDAKPVAWGNDRLPASCHPFRIVTLSA